MKYTNLISITQTLQKLDLFAFDTHTFANLFSLDKISAAHLLSRLESERLIERIERGKYLLLSITPERVLSNHLFIGNHLVMPSYISFWSALHHYGFTDQTPRKVFVATTRKKPEINFHEIDYKFVSLPPKHFFGYHRELIADLPVNIADEPRAIIDSILFPHYAGGLRQTAQALWMAIQSQETDVFLNLLVEYSNRIGNRSLGSRLGYLLELMGCSVDGLHIAKGPVALDPQTPRGGKFNGRWKIYVNIPVADLFTEGVA